jgi:hypothetical protein
MVPIMKLLSLLFLLIPSLEACASPHEELSKELEIMSILVSPPIEDSEKQPAPSSSEASFDLPPSPFLQEEVGNHTLSSSSSSGKSLPDLGLPTTFSSSSTYSNFAGQPFGFILPSPRKGDDVETSCDLSQLTNSLEEKVAGLQIRLHSSNKRDKILKKINVLNWLIDFAQMLSIGLIRDHLPLLKLDLYDGSDREIFQSTLKRLTSQKSNDNSYELLFRILKVTLNNSKPQDYLRLNEALETQIFKSLLKSNHFFIGLKNESIIKTVLTDTPFVEMKKENNKEKAEGNRLIFLNWIASRVEHKELNHRTMELLQLLAKDLIIKGVSLCDSSEQVLNIFWLYGINPFVSAYKQLPSSHPMAHLSNIGGQKETGEESRINRTLTILFTQQLYPEIASDTQEKTYRLSKTHGELSSQRDIRTVLEKHILKLIKKRLPSKSSRHQLTIYTWLLDFYDQLEMGHKLTFEQPVLELNLTNSENLKFLQDSLEVLLGDPRIHQSRYDLISNIFKYLLQEVGPKTYLREQTKLSTQLFKALLHNGDFFSGMPNDRLVRTVAQRTKTGEENRVIILNWILHNVHKNTLNPNITKLFSHIFMDLKLKGEESTIAAQHVLDLFWYHGMNLLILEAKYSHSDFTVEFIKSGTSIDLQIIGDRFFGAPFLGDFIPKP